MGHERLAETLRRRGPGPRALAGWFDTTPDQANDSAEAAVERAAVAMLRGDFATVDTLPLRVLRDEARLRYRERSGQAA